MAASKDATPTADQEAALAERKYKDKMANLLLANISVSVLQHVINLQSEIALFTAACNGDVAMTARNLVNTQSLTGLIGLLFNQIGGKCSDALGRKPFFLVGPLSNLLVGLLVFRRSKSLSVLFATRILKLIATTFSGTVMTTASLADTLDKDSMDTFNAKVPMVIGIAVVAGPFLEGFITKMSGGRHRFVYLALSALGVIQAVMNMIQLKESLPQEKRISMQEVTKSVSSFNPFSFMKIYTGDNNFLKQVVSVVTLQNCLEGRCTSDVFQMWAKNNLKWGADEIRNFVSVYGGANVASGFLQHMCAQQLTTKAYTLLTSLSVGLGVSMHGLGERGMYMWGALPVMFAGINGGTSLKLKAIQMDIAARSGIGLGEFSAWVNNMKVLSTALAPWVYGQWYAWCVKHGYYSGSVWWVAGFLGAFLPLAMFYRIPDEAFGEGSAAEKKKVANAESGAKS